MTEDTNPRQDNGSDHYFSEEPTAASRHQEFSIPGGDGLLTLRSESGVFSAHGLDKGTAVLLDHMERYGFPIVNNGSNIADVGCGSGALALTLASRFPESRVFAVDVNQRARSLCADNARRNGLTNVEVLAPDEVGSDVAFDLIWSNPPIRIGKEALHRLMLQWLEKMTPDGRMHLVVGKNLGADSLSKWLEETGCSTTKLGSSKGFRVIEVTRGDQ